jgi:Holliday junction resolvasome RuvABC endonuclease subunit
MKYVGVDPSITNTGVVVLDDKGLVQTVANTNSIKTRQDDYLKLRDIADYVVNTIAMAVSMPDTATIYYEDYSYNSVNRTYRMGELGGVLRSELIMHFGSINLIAPRQLKKFATNNGAADKELMIYMAKRESEFIRNLPKVSSDICDAYYLAMFGYYVNNFNKVVNPTLLRQRMEVVRALSQ